MSGSTDQVVVPTYRHPVLRIVNRLSEIVGVIAALMIVVAVGITCQMIYVRGVLNQSTVWQTEAVIYLMIGATMLGLPYVQRVRGHVNVDLLPLMLPSTLRRGLAVLCLVLTLATMLVMVYYGFELFHFAWSRGWGSGTVWNPPLWIPYVAMPIGFGLYFIQLAIDLWAVVIGEDAPFSLKEVD